LEHDLHRAAKLLPGVIRRLDRIQADQIQRAGIGSLDQRHHAAERGLAAAGLPDDGERLALLDAERHPAHRVQLGGLAEDAARDRIGAAQRVRFGDDAHADASVSAGATASSAMRCSSREGSPRG
jgi:hypothetical protein